MNMKKLIIILITITLLTSCATQMTSVNNNQQSFDEIETWFDSIHKLNIPSQNVVVEKS